MSAPGAAGAGGRARRRLGLGLLLAVAGTLAFDPAGAGASDARRPATVPVLVDAAGREIGRLVGGGLGPGPILLSPVAIRAGGETVLALMGRDKVWFGTAFVGFAGPGCLGAPLLVALGSTASAFFPASGTATGAELFVQDGPVSPHPIGSLVNPFVVPPTCQAAPPGTIVPAALARVLLDLGTLTPPFVPALATRPDPAGPQGRDAAARLTLVDAAGRVLGPLVAPGTLFGSQPGGSVVFRAGGRPAVLRATPAGVVGGSDDAVYQSTDCTGPALIESSGTPAENFFRQTALGRDGLVHGETGSPSTLPIQSRWDTGSDPAVCVTFPPGTSMSVLATEPLLDPAALTTPLAVP